MLEILFTYWGLMIGTVVLGVGGFVLFNHLWSKWLERWAEEHYPADEDGPTTEDLKNHIDFIEKEYLNKDM